MDMTEIQDAGFSVGDLSSAAQVLFYNYWLDIRGSRQMPSRSDFDPMKIPSVLPYVIMKDVFYGPTRFKLRLIGSKCKVPNSYLGRFIDETPQIKSMQKMLDICIGLKKPYFYVNDISLDGNFAKVYSSLVLPFSHDDKNVNILMACHCSID